MALTKHKSTMRFRKSSTAAAPRSHNDPSSVPRHVLSPSNTNSNGRRKSSMFPSPKSILKKRPKTTSCVLVEAVEYPTETNVPSKALIRALYDDALVDSSNNNQVELDEVGSGLLSLEQVLLPSVARMHADSLKQLQAKLQRQQQQQHDATKDHIKAMEACRVALYQCVAVGMHHARESRMERDARLTEQWHDEKVTRQQEVAQRREEARALQKQQRLVRAKQQCRVNRAAKQEGLNLMAQLAVLEKEERLWKEAQAQLRIRQERLKQNQQRNKAAAVDAVKCQDDSKVMEVDHVPQEDALQEAVQNITTSSVRIHQAVESVSRLLQQAQDIRKEVYETYKQDFQFHGYRGVTDSKGLFRAIMLSQQDDDEA